MKLKFLPILLLTLVTAMSSCVNLKALNDYASSSKQAIEEFNKQDIKRVDIFLTGHFESCAVSLVVDKKISKEVDNCGIQSIDIEKFNDNLKVFKHADSLSAFVSMVLLNYFEGLTDLSNNDATSFELKSEQLEALLGDTLNFPKLDKEVVNASKGLVKLLTKISTSAYRQRKLKQVLKEANPDVLKLLKLQVFTNYKLAKHLQKQRDVFHDYYSDSWNQSSQRNEKAVLNRKYIDYNATFEGQKLLVEKYSKALVTMSEAHNRIIDEGLKIKTKALLKFLASYTTEIAKIKNELKREKQ